MYTCIHFCIYIYRYITLCIHLYICMYVFIYTNGHNVPSHPVLAPPHPASRNEVCRIKVWMVLDVVCCNVLQCVAVYGVCSSL